MRIEDVKVLKAFVINQRLHIVTKDKELIRRENEPVMSPIIPPRRIKIQWHYWQFLRHHSKLDSTWKFCYPAILNENLF